MGGSALHDRAVPVSLSATSRSAQPAPGPAGRSGVVVRLEFPDDGTGRRTSTASAEPRDVENHDAASRPALDPTRLARAVEDLIRAIDPSLAQARVEIEVTRPGPVAAARTPVLSSTERPAGPLAERDDRDGRHDRDDSDGREDSDEADDDPFIDPGAGRAAHPTAPGAELGLDLAGRTLSVDGRVITLTRREFDLLAYLQDHRGVALGRQELMSTVWRSGYLVGDRTIDVHVRRLRVKLGQHADRLRTLRGFGYCLD